MNFSIYPSLLVSFIFHLVIATKFQILPCRHPHHHHHHHQGFNSRSHHLIPVHRPQLIQVSRSPHDDWQPVQLPPTFWSSGENVGSRPHSYNDESPPDDFVPLIRVVQSYRPDHDEMSNHGIQQESPESGEAIDLINTKINTQPGESTKIRPQINEGNDSKELIMIRNQPIDDGSRELFNQAFVQKYQLNEDTLPPSQPNSVLLHQQLQEIHNQMITESPPILTKKRKKSKGKRKKKKSKIQLTTTNMELTSPTTPTTDTYSVNKIIVIEDDGSTHGGSSSIESSSESSKPNNGFVNLKDFHRPRIPTMPTSAPAIRTIGELHERLNQTLLNRPSTLPGQMDQSSMINVGVDYESSTIPPILAELIKRITAASTTTTMSTITFPMVNDSNHGLSTSKHVTGSSGYFSKSNRFQFENSWIHTTSTTERPLVSTSPTMYFTSQRPPSTTLSSSFSSTTTTTLNTPIKSNDQSIESQSMIRKHYGLETSSSARHEMTPHHHMTSSSTETVDISQIASIIIGFIISMMVLAGVILMVMHKDAVQQNFGRFSSMIEERYPRFRRNTTDGNGTNNSDQSTNFDGGIGTQRSSHETRCRIPPPPPPPPPPPKPQCSKLYHQSDLELRPEPSVGQDLIEQIIGGRRPTENGGFTNKKCRQYFSRVHRWVPKRPPLPDDLKSST
ncbi:hypothetical protein BLOT_007994 [Blomia tropicalis]|nr:hypothetical protein BLOT_007994 [Blomia tropicalis]